MSATLRQLVLDQRKGPRKATSKPLEPLEKKGARLPLTVELIHKRMHDPISLQWLVDDFIESAGEGLESRVDLFIRAGLPIDKTHTVLGYTALHAAANLSDGRVMARLIRAGANVNTPANNTFTPLHTAVMFGNQTCVEQLLRHDAAKLPGRVGFLSPPRPPARVVCELREPFSLHLNWEPGISKQPTHILEYKVNWYLPSAQDCAQATCQSTKFIICGLVPATTYEVTVQARNTAGWSENSVPIIMRTTESVPTAPSAPRITSVADKFMKMQLKLPEDNGFPILKLCVQAQRTGSINLSTTDAIMSLMDVKTVESSWSQLWLGEPNQLPTVGRNTLEFIATGLTPGQVYFIRIKAANALGWSDAGDVSDDAPKMVQRSATSIQLIWPKPYSAYEIDYYKLTYRNVGSSDWALVSDRIRSQSFNVQKLVPATAYQFLVRPHYTSVPTNIPEWEDESYCTVSPVYHTEGMTPEPPMDLVLVSRTQTSMELTWTTPRCNGFVVLNYELQQQVMTDREGSAIEDLNMPWICVSNSIHVDEVKVSVVELHVGTPYRFRVRARNSLGWGVYGTPSQAFWTHAFLPPTPPVANSKTSHSLGIIWDDQPDINCKLDQKEYFELQVCGLPSYSPLDAISKFTCDNWVLVDDSCRFKECNVPNLSALSWYCFRVRAWVRYRGWTEFSGVSDPIQTLRRM
ncbi:hypothetical protein THRCLA_20387 [Thraustotheca clavata]|uniref:Fibronectin type-III domain-containing protein n=1 Tax=Thraustotheca clavata TaxID=74557 RepID=A0A1W0A858_9STRA|nr:hypothetical protein THRCLA_20387 [Thraustotheca clavata]